MNFGQKMMNWIETMVFTNTISFLVNGCPTSEFQVSRGLRQGDPLSPFLFILAIEVLSCMMRNVMRSEDYKGFSLNKNIQFDIL